MICKSTLKNGYYWVYNYNDWDLYLYNGKWHTTDDVESIEVSDLLDGCTCIPVPKPLTVDI